MHRRDPRSLIGCAPKQWPLSDCDSRKIRPWNQLRAPHAQAAVRVRSAGKNQKTTISEDQYFDALENNDVQRGFGNPSSPFGGKSEDDGDTERWS
ncbi:hypothetical protein D8674_025175 [Pyrus ussuriensis x Pyrus communis]|uniref:Uncharacterized protein n=1 Tax=Pyrus ussuriensis x Pyrus communis TaxID=2448454 RepID=A0A5N5H8W6_9ROSA|nr:hypothetical protein D8674_025175 [Pyrus ussuriensis x Pyrus communis]